MVDEQQLVVPGGLSGVEFLRLGRKDHKEACRQLAALSPELQASVCMELRPEVRIEFLMLLEQPEQVVPLLPEIEIGVMARASGMEDAAFLLELATPAQTRACVDLDCWNGEELLRPRFAEWIDALVEAGPETLEKALETFDMELWVLWVLSEAQIQVMGKEEIPPDGYFTLDGVVYFGIRDDLDPVRVHATAMTAISRNPAFYWRLVYGTIFESPSECEEMALRWRTNRMQDVGFPDREQAMQVYRSLDPERTPVWETSTEENAVALSHRVPRQLRGTLLGDALAGLDPARAAEILSYVLSVANAVAVADGMCLSDPDEIPKALDKAVRGIDEGLRELSKARAQAPEQVLESTLPRDLFRVAATRNPALRDRSR